jgi:peptidyl-prolyl cis-trans isomerase C
MMSTVTVNGVAIDTQAIAAEMQNHPAESPGAAEGAAVQALVVRELLLQEARSLGLAVDPRTDEKGRRETEEDALIRQLLDREVSVPDADTETCRRYYENNRQRFRSPDLYEPSHILLAASPEDAQAYADTAREAAQLIAMLSERPEQFEAFARDRSDCTSRESGGKLGQVTRADVVPEFATFLCSLEEGQLCPVPVKTRYGVHVLRLDRVEEGKLLPFEAVEDRIADYLQEASWRRAVAQYIKLLAGKAAIEGVALAAADSPLVQ